MPVAYGIDLGGYSTGTSRVLRATATDSRGRVIAELLDSVWSRSANGSCPMTTSREQIHEEMRVWDNSASIVVDVPIDLKGLPHVFGHVPVYHWQLTQRAIDYVLSGLPPLADRIG